MANFDATTKLEQSARLYMATNLLQQKQTAAIDGVFDHLDRANDDVLTRGELKIAFEKAHGKDKSVKIEQMLEDVFERIDTEKTGVISYPQFVAAAADDSVLLTKKNLRATFDAFDKGNTGSINVDDLKALFNDGQQNKIMSRRNARRLMKQVDDGDGKITFENFCDLMLR